MSVLTQLVAELNAGTIKIIDLILVALGLA
jgi:hypothetical protein